MSIKELNEKIHRDKYSDYEGSSLEFFERIAKSNNWKLCKLLLSDVENGLPPGTGCMTVKTVGSLSSNTLAVKTRILKAHMKYIQENKDIFPSTSIVRYIFVDNRMDVLKHLSERVRNSTFFYANPLNVSIEMCVFDWFDCMQCDEGFGHVF